MIEVIKFGAEWCGPCRYVAPAVKNLQEKFNVEGSDVQVTSIDVDQNPEMAKEYKVQSIPTFVIKQDGNVIFKKVGVMNEREIEEEINKLKLEKTK